MADDAAGGCYAVNSSGLGKDVGKVYFLSPDNLEWEPLDLTYTDFLNFCFNGDLADYYKTIRWKDWKIEVAKLDGNSTYNFFSFLWTKEGKDINKVSGKAIPVEEQFSFTLDMRKQLGLTKNGL